MLEPGARRVRVVGSSGAGKSTFARALAARLGVPCVELDEVFWGPNWTLRDGDEAREELARFIDSDAARSGWVIEGNWESARRGLADDADLIVWLDYPRALVLSRVVRRTLWRSIRRIQLWHGNTERLGSLLLRDPEQNIVLYSWQTHPRIRRDFLKKMRCDPRILRLRWPRDARRLLASPISGEERRRPKPAAGNS